VASQELLDRFNSTILSPPLSFGPAAAMSSQIGAVAEVVHASTKLTDMFDEAFNDLGVSDRIPSLKEANQEFVKALLVYRDTVLQDVLAHAMAQGQDNSSKIGKSTEWGSKRAWVKSPSSAGTSSMMSVVGEEGRGGAGNNKTIVISHSRLML
jgi:hypothetical protein